MDGSIFDDSHTIPGPAWRLQSCFCAASSSRRTREFSAFPCLDYRRQISFSRNRRMRQLDIRPFPSPLFCHRKLSRTRVVSFQFYKRLSGSLRRSEAFGARNPAHSIGRSSTITTTTNIPSSAEIPRQKVLTSNQGALHCHTFPHAFSVYSAGR